MNRFIEITDDRSGYSHSPVLVNVDYIFKIEPWLSSDGTGQGTVVCIAVNDYHDRPFQTIQTYRPYAELAKMLSLLSTSPTIPDNSVPHSA